MKKRAEKPMKKRAEKPMKKRAEKPMKKHAFLQEQAELHSGRGLIISLIDLNYGI